MNETLLKLTIVFSPVVLGSEQLECFSKLHRVLTTYQTIYGTSE